MQSKSAFFLEHFNPFDSVFVLDLVTLIQLLTNVFTTSKSEHFLLNVIFI